MTTGDMMELLGASYCAVVTQRHPDMEGWHFDEATKDHLMAVARSLQEPTRYGILINGQVGNGKTTMVLALREAMIWLKRNFSDTLPTLRLTDAREVTRAAADDEEFTKLMNTPLLAIDDAGKEAAEVMHYGNSLLPMTELLEYRYEHQLFTILTSNVTVDELAEKYGERVFDRLIEMMNVITFTNGSYRV